MLPRKSRFSPGKSLSTWLKRLTCLTNAEIGTRFGITYSAVSKAAGDIERLRQEDKKVNREVEELISHFNG